MLGAAFRSAWSSCAQRTQRKCASDGRERASTCPHAAQVWLVCLGSTAISCGALYASMARRLLQPVSRMVRLSPALACTCVPGFSLVPLADRVIAWVWSSSTATVPLAPDLRCETPRIRRVQDAGVAAVADGDLADVHVDTGHGPVVRALNGGDGVADDRHPLAVDAFQDGLDGLSVRVRVAAAPAQPEPAQLREVQLVVPDADVLRDRHAVAAAALEPRAPGLAPEEPPPRVGLVLQRVPHRGARHGLQPGRRPAQLRERLAQREERRRTCAPWRPAAPAGPASRSRRTGRRRQPPPGAWLSPDCRTAPGRRLGDVPRRRAYPSSGVPVVGARAVRSSRTGGGCCMRVLVAQNNNRTSRVTDTIMSTIRYKPLVKHPGRDRAVRGLAQERWGQAPPERRCDSLRLPQYDMNCYVSQGIGRNCDLFDSLP